MKLGISGRWVGTRTVASVDKILEKKSYTCIYAMAKGEVAFAVELCLELKFLGQLISPQEVFRVNVFLYTLFLLHVWIRRECLEKVFKSVHLYLL